MRESYLLNQSWRFICGDDTSAKLKDYDDSVWKEVHLPHSVDVMPIISSGGRNYQGVSRYRKSFEVVESGAGERFVLEFQGAMQVLEVWINNHQLPTHYCGYTPAVYDVTEHILFGEANCISVRLDNSDRSAVPPGKQQEVLDFSYEGGIYRDVYLHRLPSVHITNAVLENIPAGGGMFLSYEDVSAESATIRVQTHVRNRTSSGENISIKHTLVDENGVSVASTEEIMVLESEMAEHNVQKLKVKKPNLWFPDQPYLYALKTSLVVEGQTVDVYDNTVGIRTFEFTKDDGLHINGQKTKVSGCNYHQTFTHVGNAMSNNLLRRDVRKMREAGMMHIRSHYPFANAFIDECNKLGMMLTISNPGWQYYEDGVFVERAFQNLRDILHWLRNEPSIIIWEGILNETSMPVEFQEKIHEIVHEEMPYGPCYTGSDSGYSDVVYRSFDPGMFNPDLVKENPKLIEEAKERFDKPKWIREYGDSPDNFFDQSCAWRVPRAWGEEIMLKQVRRMIWDKTPWVTNYKSNYNDEALCGFGMWPGIEHNRGYHMNPCYGGFLDLQRLPKYSFYFFKSQQSPDFTMTNVASGPMVYIAHSWTDVGPDDITVYSNCDSVRLYHNDQLIREQEPDHVAIKHPPFTFTNDFYYGRERTGIRVEGVINGEVVATDERFAPGVTHELRLSLDDMNIPMVADGSDLMFVRCESVDADGNLVPLTCDAHEIEFTVEGSAHIVGDRIKRTELGVTGILIQSTTKAGEVSVKASLVLPQKYRRIAVKPAGINWVVNNYK